MNRIIVPNLFQEVRLDTTLSELSKTFERHHFALVVTSQRVYSGVESVEKKMVLSVVTRYGNVYNI